MLTSSSRRAASAPSAPTPCEEVPGALRISSRAEDTPPPEPNREPILRVARGALHLLRTQPFTWATSLLNLILLPRLLGSQALGQWTFGVAATSLVGLVVSLGLPNFLVRRVAWDPQRATRDTAAILALQVTAALLAAAAVALVVSRVAVAVPPRVLYILLAAMVIGSAQNVLFSLLIGQERLAGYAWISAASEVVGDGLGLATLALGGGLTLFVAARLAASLPVFVLLWRVSGIRMDRHALDPGAWRRLAGGGLPFLGWNLAMRCYGEIDKVLLGFLAPASVVGWYGASIQIMAIPVFIPALIVTPLLPALSRESRDAETFGHTLRSSLNATLVLTIPMSAGIIALAPSIPGILHWPSDWQQTVPLITILSLQVPLVAADMVLATGLFALKRERAWLCVGLVASVFNPLLNLWLIPVFQARAHDGAIGASLVTVATEVLMMAGALLLLPSGCIRLREAWLALRVVLAGFGCYLATAWLYHLALPLGIAAGAIAYLSLCLGLLVVSLREVIAFSRMGRSLVLRRLRPAAP